MTINIKKKKIKDEIIYKYHVFNIIDLIKVRDPHVIIISQLPNNFEWRK